MDIQPTNQQPISDDQELAKVLAGVSQQADDAAATTPAGATPTAPATPDEPKPVAEPAPSISEPAAAAPLPPMPTPSGDLDTIKKDALSELRPLVDKLNVSPEEKFDTYLLLIRSTDDHSLIAPAHDAARSIADEARRAQALLDIIKEIDYLSNPQQAAA
jgi:hypothetical protein